jgi:hypothetical protein
MLLKRGEKGRAARPAALFFCVRRFKRLTIVSGLQSGAAAQGS